MEGVNNAKFIALNCNGFKSNTIFIDQIIKNNDCIFLSESWLLNSEQFLLHNYKLQFKVISVPANKNPKGRPFGGTIMLLRKSTFSNINIITDENYTTTVQADTGNLSILISGVYLQSITNNSSECTEIYKTQLSNITGLHRRFEEVSESIILGDFQSFPQNTVSSNRSAQYNILSKHMSDFITENDLEPIDISQGSGPNYTYHHFTLPNKSYIDHILVSQNLVDHMTDIHVQPPNAMNISDHLPVSASLRYDASVTQSIDDDKDTDFVPNFIWKNKKFLDLYNKKVSSLILDDHTPDIDKKIDNLHLNLIKAAKESYHELNQKFHHIQTKPWWNSDLTKSRKILQTMFNEWRDKGFPKDVNNVEFNRYCFARKTFRQLVKSSKNQLVNTHYIKADNLRNITPASFWREIRNMRNCSSSKLYTINNRITTKDIANEFKDHFKSILTTPKIEAIDNDKTNELLNELLQNLDTGATFSIAQSEVSKAINKLNRDKARDPFQIKAEHFVHAVNPTFLTYLTQLINSIFNEEEIPKSICTSVIMPLVKSNKKSLHDPNNYRGISLSPIITKIIELIVLDKYPELSDHKQTQFGFIKGSSTVHAELLLKDTIKYFNSNKSPVYICSLDASKAFDSCNWYHLFHKLSNGNIAIPALRWLIKLYLNCEAKVKYKNYLSELFNPKQGVRQGSVLSPFLYNIYTEDLLDQIKSLNAGCKLSDGTDMSIIAFADDIILLSPTLHGLQRMIDHCVKFGSERNIKFNHEKTQFIVSGKSNLSNVCISLEKNVVTPQCYLKHLGFTWELQSNDITLRRHMDNRIGEMWAMTSTLISCGIRKLHPNSIVHVFKSVVIPRLLYGIEIVSLSKSDRNYLDRQARCSLKSMMGVSKHARNYLHIIYNLPEISDLINNKRIGLLYQLTQNSSTRHHTLHLLTRDYSERKHSVIQDLLDSALSYNINPVDCLLGSKPKLLTTPKELSPDKQADIDKCKECILLWHDLQKIFRNILEFNIPKT